jgi:hypothetical protein
MQSGCISNAVHTRSGRCFGVLTMKRILTTAAAFVAMAWAMFAVAAEPAPAYHVINAVKVGGEGR